MPTAVEDRLRKVSKKYTDVNQKLKSLPDDSDSEFWKIIHNPGYTTVIDVNYATGILEALEVHTKSIESLKRTLVDGARSGLQQNSDPVQA